MSNQPAPFQRKVDPLWEGAGAGNGGVCVYFLFLFPLGISSTTRICSASPWVKDLSSEVVVEGRLPTARCFHLRPVVRNHLVLANQGPQSSRNPSLCFPIFPSLFMFSGKYHPRFLQYCPVATVTNYYKLSDKHVVSLETPTGILLRSRGSKAAFFLRG